MKRALPRALPRVTAPLVTALLVLPLAACGGDSAKDGGADAKSTGPITIWYANNADEIAWAEQMVTAWNTEHPDEKITAKEIPAGKSSEEVIGAAITAGNAPCLIFNTAPAAVSQFHKQGGLVPLDDFPGAAEYIEERSGGLAEQYRSDDGSYHQLPWKSNPVMISYNKEVFAEAGLDPEQPALGTFEDFLETSRTLVADGGVQAAIWPSPSSEFFQPWFDFYPLFAAETGGTQLVEDGEARFDGPEGQRVAEFWRSMYDEGLSPREAHNGDAFGDGASAMTIAGPWAAKVYSEKVDYGVVPVPTSEGVTAEETRTFSDAKSVGMYTACENRGTAWEVLKFATSSEQDAQLLELTGQMPVRENLTGDFPDFFADNPQYQAYADAAGTAVEVPNVPNSVTIWQTFRDAYSRAVIFGETDPAKELGQAADEVDKLAGER